MSSPKKRIAEEDTYEDPVELANAVIPSLLSPQEKTTVAQVFANDKNSATEVQAYAKLAGNSWTYYVKTLSISIGRNTETAATGHHHASQQDEKAVDIDLGPAKVVSRQHALIAYNLNTRCWELKVNGRNGARLDGKRVSCGPDSVPTILHSGAIVDIGGTQMMFILPDSPPNISKDYLAQHSSKLPKKSSKLAKTAGSSNNSLNSFSNSNANSYSSFNSNLKGFQMFNKNQLNDLDESPNMSLDQDLSKDDSKDIKPPYSYATMITQAILSNSDGVLSLAEIYDWIAGHYAFYRHSKSGWQNSIRHNLSLNKAFEKVPRRPNEPGKGMKWQISDSYKDEFLKKIQNGSLSKARRGSSVSRQLQLHLATHNNLPESQTKKLPMPPQLPQQDPQLHSLPNALRYMGQANTVQPSVSSGMQPTNMPSLSMSPPNVLPIPMTKTEKSPQYTMPPQQPLQPLNNSSLGSVNTSNSSNTNPTTTTTDLNIAFSSPKRYPVSAIEAYTPERGKSKNQFPGTQPPNNGNNANNNANGNGNSNNHPMNGNNNLQSSPALWNFVQFSTPNQQSPIKKNELLESPILYKSKQYEMDRDKDEDLKNIDLAKGFKN